MTGFISTNATGTKGLILIFREIGAPESALLNIPYIKQAIVLDKIGGDAGKLNYLSPRHLKSKSTILHHLYLCDSARLEKINKRYI